MEIANKEIDYAKLLPFMTDRSLVRAYYSIYFQLKDATIRGDSRVEPLFGLGRLVRREIYTRQESLDSDKGDNKYGK